VPACRRAAWAGCTKSPPVTSSRTLILLGDGHAPTKPLPPRERIKPGGSEDSGPPGFFSLARRNSSLPFPKEQTPTVALPTPACAQWVVGLLENGELAPSPVAPATGRLCRFSARRQVPTYPAYRRQAQTGRRAQRQINIVKVTHYRRVSCLALLSGFSYSSPLR
jgi:hypothetical protein